jgi:hypothetical protein
MNFLYILNMKILMLIKWSLIMKTVESRMVSIL